MKNLRVDTHDQHLLVIRAVENPDLAALRQIAGRAPEKIMLQFDGAGMLEAEHLASLRIDPRHHMCDDAVLAGGIHGLKYQQHRVAVRGIQQLLLGAQLLDVILQELLILVVAAVDRSGSGGPVLEVDLAAPSRTRKFSELIFIPDPSACRELTSAKGATEPPELPAPHVFISLPVGQRARTPVGHFRQPLRTPPYRLGRAGRRILRPIQSPARHVGRPNNWRILK